MRVLACVDEVPSTDGTCTTQQWVEQPYLLPPFSIDDAQSVAIKFMWALASVMAIKLLRRAV